MHAVSARLRKYGLRIASSRPTASSAQSSRRRGARPEGTRGSTDPSCLSFKQVIALPLPHRPLFPGFYMPIYVKDQKLLQALVENGKRSVPYAGAFLVKDEEGTDPNIMTSSDSEKSIDDPKGKELLRRLHEVGTLAQITSIHGDQVVLLVHRRLRITEMVQEDPLTVKVDHLKEKPYNKDDDIIKATSFEVISTLREVLRTSSLWKDHVQTYTQHMGDFNYPRLADFGAAISGANKLLCQEVLEELDVYKRLKLTLELVKKEMEISKLQQSIAKAIEEKISGDQRRYLLNEQLKAINKVWLQTDKAAVSPEAVLLQQPELSSIEIERICNRVNDAILETTTIGVPPLVIGDGFGFLTRLRYTCSIAMLIHIICSSDWNWTFFFFFVVTYAASVIRVLKGS